MASKPVIMVVYGETLRVSRGSTTAAFGMKEGWFVVRFSVPLLITETCVTSLPVPAVVGTQMMESAFSGRGRAPR